MGLCFAGATTELYFFLKKNSCKGATTMYSLFWKTSGPKDRDQWSWQGNQHFSYIGYIIINYPKSCCPGHWKKNSETYFTGVWEPLSILLDLSTTSPSVSIIHFVHLLRIMSTCRVKVRSLKCGTCTWISRTDWSISIVLGKCDTALFLFNK